MTRFIQLVFVLFTIFAGKLLLIVIIEAYLLPSLLFAFSFVVETVSKSLDVDH